MELELADLIAAWMREQCPGWNECLSSGQADCYRKHFLHPKAGSGNAVTGMYVDVKPFAQALAQFLASFSKALLALPGLPD